MVERAAASVNASVPLLAFVSAGNLPNLFGSVPAILSALSVHTHPWRKIYQRAFRPQHSCSREHSVLSFLCAPCAFSVPSAASLVLFPVPSLRSLRLLALTHEGCGGSWVFPLFALSLAAIQTGRDRNCQAASPMLHSYVCVCESTRKFPGINI